MKKTITKEFTFDASHRLIDNKLTDEENVKIYGKCFNFPSHGHLYKLQITVSGEEKNGMILNFNIIKDIYNQYIHELFDHHFINDIECMKGKITTCENMLDVMWGILNNQLKQYDVILEKIRLYETPTSWGKLER